MYLGVLAFVVAHFSLRRSARGTGRRGSWVCCSRSRSSCCYVGWALPSCAVACRGTSKGRSSGTSIATRSGYLAGRRWQGRLVAVDSCPAGCRVDSLLMANCCASLL